MLTPAQIDALRDRAAQIADPLTKYLLADIARRISQAGQLTSTAAEFAAGCILNLWLGWGVWDYSHLPGNVLGQVCPQFAALWCVVSGPVIVLLDWRRYAVRGGERPRYTWK